MKPYENLEITTSFIRKQLLLKYFKDNKTLFAV